MAQETALHLGIDQCIEISQFPGKSPSQEIDRYLEINLQLEISQHLEIDLLSSEITKKTHHLNSNSKYFHFEVLYSFLFLYFLTEICISSTCKHAKRLPTKPQSSRRRWNLMPSTHLFTTSSSMRDNNWQWLYTTPR